MKRAAALTLVLAACELVVGADFDDKTLAIPGTGGSGGVGGSEAPKLPLGAPCTTPDECESAHCADGVCCEDACDGECADCSTRPGSCELLPLKTECTGGYCDGAGTCATGVTRWAKRFGDTDFEEATACEFDPNGSLLVAGRFDGSINLGGETLTQPMQGAGYSIFVAKFDSDGAHEWSVALGSEGDVDVTGIAVDALGGAAITGTFQGVIDFGNSQVSSTNARAGYVIKLSASGEHQWHTTFGGTAVLSRNGGTQDILLQHIALGPNSEVYVAGSYGGSIAIGDYQLAPGGPYGIYVARIDPGGAVVWARSSTSDPGGFVAPRAIGAHPGGGAFVAGHFQYADAWFDAREELLWNASPQGSGGHDAFIVAYDDGGHHLWSLDPALNEASQAIEDLAVDARGNVLVSGTFGGLLDFGNGPVFHPSGARGAATMFDAFLAKLSGNGRRVWADSFGAFLSPFLLDTRVASDGAANVVFAGRHRDNTVDFGFGGIAPEDNGWFVTKLAANQEPLWARSFGTEPPAGTLDTHRPWDLAADRGSGAVAFCGRITPTVDYGTGALPSNGSPDAMVVVLEP